MLRVLVGEEGLPAAVGHVVAPDELDLIRLYLVVDVCTAVRSEPPETATFIAIATAAGSAATGPAMTFTATAIETIATAA